MAKGHSAGRLIVRAYALVLGFVAVFAVALAIGGRVKHGLQSPLWAFGAAALFTLPALAPWVRTAVLPRLRSLKVASVEISLNDLEAPGRAVASAAALVSQSLADDPVLSEYAGRMTSLSNSIVDGVKALQVGQYEVLPVDLATGWVIPNLYFLALLAAQKTAVRRVAFMDSRAGPDRFVCASTPGEILTALEWRHPELREAALAARFDQHPRSAEYQAGVDFFDHLGSVYAGRMVPPTERVVPLTPEMLLWLLGPAAHRDAVQWTEQDREAAYRSIVLGTAPYVAALDGDRLLFLLSREHIASAVARAMLSGGS